MPKPEEVATLNVNNKKFEDWETVWVQVRWHEGFSYFRFTAAERDDLYQFARQAPLNLPLWQKLQVKPGDACTIALAGKTVITGFVETRQVAYNATSHGVQLIGKSATAWPARSSVDTKTGSFDGMTLEQVVRKVLAPYGVNARVIGTIDQKPFEKLQNQPGELIWDFFERIARPKGVIMGSDPFGNFLLIGEHASPVVGQLIEGKNIKQCQCIITMEHAFTEHDVRGQQVASDENHGPAASEMQAVVPGAKTPVKSKLITPSEQNVTLADLYQRAYNEAKWHNATIFTVTAFVQGWLSNGVELWEPGQIVYIYSPMALCDHLMAIETATFTQDSQNGTQTQLDLKMPWALNNAPVDVSNPNSQNPGK
jgi:prophage tail gpP-like protein